MKLPPDAIRARAEGINEIRDRIPVLTRIRVHYTLRIPPGSRETVERALERHAEKCPTAVSLRGAVEVEWDAEVTEDPELAGG